MSIEDMALEIKKPDLTPEICLDCKYLKCYFSPVHNACEIHCKKGDKYFLADKPFACGQFKTRYRRKQNGKINW